MYILSKELKAGIEETARKAELVTNGAVKFEEYIALPFHGCVILRFTLEKDEVSLEELDAYEAALYGVAGDEFLVDFMGSVYQKAGVDYTRIDQRLKELADELASEPVTPSVHCRGIRADAAYLLVRAGLDPAEKVWEIQAEDEGLTLLIMENEARTIKEPRGGSGLYVGAAPEKQCQGLIRAAFYAKRKGVSLARLLNK